MFASLKNSRMFAVPNFYSIFVVGAFLCTANSVSANDTGYQTHLDNTATSIVMKFGDLGGDSLSYIHLVTNKIHF